ncbi:hypothetical protein [Nocardioides sp.]|uniref:hypothetical protein n=1 Tax=Nocardioides sp. TaxID=35761 RepID=UPI0031FF21F3|nr:hypothetical protein [Nocardioides sp.]
MKLWKVLGIAGLTGVAATGVIIARDERRRAQLTPDQVRKQLHQRLADIERGASDNPGTAPTAGDASPHVPAKPSSRRRRRR